MMIKFSDSTKENQTAGSTRYSGHSTRHTMTASWYRRRREDEEKLYFVKEESYNYSRFPI